MIDGDYKTYYALGTELAEITRICKEQSEPVYLTKDGADEYSLKIIEC